MPKPTIIDVEVDEVITESTSSSRPSRATTRKTSSQTSEAATNPSDIFGSFSQSDRSGHPQSSFPGLGGQLGWKHIALGKVIGKVISAFSRRGSLFRSKLWLPLWILFGILAFTVIIALALVGILFSLVKRIFSPYFDLLRRNN